MKYRVYRRDFNGVTQPYWDYLIAEFRDLVAAQLFIDHIVEREIWAWAISHGRCAFILVDGDGNS